MKLEGGSHFDRVARKYIALMDFVARILWGIAIAIFVILSLILVGSVLSRQFLGYVPAWNGEIQRYLAIWMTLLVAGALVNSDNHLSVRFAFKYMPSRLVTVTRLLQLSIISLIGIVLINWGTHYVLDSGTASVSPSMGFRMGWVYLILPITGWFFVLFSISRGLKICRSEEEVAEGRAIPDEELEIGGQ